MYLARAYLTQGIDPQFESPLLGVVRSTFLELVLSKQILSVKYFACNKFEVLKSAGIKKDIRDLLATYKYVWQGKFNGDFAVLEIRLSDGDSALSEEKVIRKLKSIPGFKDAIWDEISNKEISNKSIVRLTN